MYNLKSNTVHVYHINTNTYKNYTSLISEDEKKKASKFRFEIDQKTSIISRGALRLIASSYLKTSPEKIAFKYNEFGKPSFDMDTNLKFNISHSGNIAVLGFVKDFEIGIDIENIKRDFDVLDIANNFFSELEVQSLLKLPKENQFEGFYRCWTRKESFIKAKAKGLSFPLDSFAVSMDSNEHAKLLETKWDANEKNTWKLFSFSPKENYIGALSVKGNVESVEYRNFKIR
jgi:4'-phosphopantetheinyl transferase